jgi:hypothetical protein
MPSGPPSGTNSAPTSCPSGPPVLQEYASRAAVGTVPVGIREAACYTTVVDSYAGTAAMTDVPPGTVMSRALIAGVVDANAPMSATRTTAREA